MTDLTEDAKDVAAALFWTMDSRLTLHLVEGRPTPRMQAALDCLVANGYASVEPFNKYGGKVYRPLKDCSQFQVARLKRFVEEELQGAGRREPFILYEPIPKNSVKP